MREVLQDVVTPDMRAIKVQVENLDTRIEKLDADMNRKLDNLDRKLDVYQDVQALKEWKASLKGEPPTATH